MSLKRTAGFAEALKISLMLIGLLFLIAAAQWLFRLPLLSWGIQPRTSTGLPGIVFAPLLHASFGHLLANAIPLFVLLLLLLSNRSYQPYRTLAVIWLASGVGTWLIGRGSATHLGASGLVFGLAAFLIVAGFQLRSWRSAAVALFVLFYYGGIFYGALPRAGPISWEGHLCGALAGISVAASIRRNVTSLKTE